MLDWTSLASTIPEFLEVRSTLSGVPHGWIEWAERQVAASIKRGLVVRDPLRYRMAVLHNGVILLQESKYVADLFENAVRYAFVQYASTHGITAEELIQSIPMGKELSSRFRKPTTQVRDLVLHLTFYQLTETVARNWKCVGGGEGSRKGFRELFWREPSCRDLNAFRRDTAMVRDVRNVIAHSRQLLTPTQVQRLFRISSCWLLALDVDAAARIRAYRDRRPRFLSDLHHV